MKPAFAFRLSALLLSSVLLPGCGLKDPYVGSGPITLSPEVEAGFERYKALNFPSRFAVSVDGAGYGYSYCPQGNCSGNPQRVAIDSCEQASGGVPCKLYAKGRNVVWDHAGDTVVESASDRLTKTAPPIPAEGPSQPVTLIKCRLPDGYVISMVPERCESVGGVPD